MCHGISLYLYMINISLSLSNYTHSGTKLDFTFYILFSVYVVQSIIDENKGVHNRNKGQDIDGVYSDITGPSSVPFSHEEQKKKT